MYTACTEREEQAMLTIEFSLEFVRKVSQSVSKNAGLDGLCLQ